MKHIFAYIDGLHLNINQKNRFFIIINCLVSGILGLLIWLFIGKYYFKGPLWLICFIGYPSLFVGVFGSLLHLSNHEFK